MASRTLPSDLASRRTASGLSTLAFSITSATGTLRPALLMVSTAVSRSILQALIRMRIPRSTSFEFCMCTLTIRFSYT